MQHTQSTFQSIRNLTIHTEAWLPDGDIKAVIFLVHGVGEYAARYTNLVNYFVPRGYAVYGFDHIGHGKSGGPREMVEKFEDFIEPLMAYRRAIAEKHPGTPVFIYGHSMGGLITCFHLLDHQADFTGAILSAPPVKIPENISPLTIQIGKLLSAVAPSAGLIGLDTNYLSHDKSVVDAYNADPLVFHGKMPARLSAEMLRAMLRVNAEVTKISLPVFILQGTGDKIVDASGAPMLHEKISSTDKTLKLYDGLYHEVHNEPEHATMFQDVETWMAARL